METRKELRFLENPELRATAGNVLDGHAAVFNQWSKDLGRISARKFYRRFFAIHTRG